VIGRRRGRFRDLVQRQLALFQQDESSLLADASAAEERWRRSDRDGAEEAYGDWQLAADAIADRLLDLRETYAGTLDDDAAVAYRDAFDRVARRRFPYAAGLLDR
jgi:hypothetical protein